MNLRLTLNQELGLDLTMSDLIFLLSHEIKVFCYN